MDLVKFEEKNVILAVTQDELGNFGNALNEVCNGIHISNFDIKIGISEDQARSILKTIIKIYDFLKKEQNHNEFDVFGVITLLSVKNKMLMISMPITHFISLNKALKTVSEEIEGWEIPIRMGATLDEINTLLKNSSDIIKKNVVNEQ